MRVELKQFAGMLLLIGILLVLLSCTKCSGDDVVLNESASNVIEQADGYIEQGFEPSIVKPAIIDAEQLDKPAVMPIDAKLNKLITIDFIETPIEDVLRMIAQDAGIDIVKSPKVVGMVSATLNNVPVGEVLDNILAVHNFGYVKTNNMIRIVPASELVNPNEKMVSKVYRLTYADVTAVSQALGKFISSKGSMSVNPGTSNIVITDTESKVKAIDEFIEEVDRVTEQVVVEVRIYDVTDNNAISLEAMWNAGRVTDNAVITETKSTTRTESGGVVTETSTESTNKVAQPVTQTTGAGIPYSDQSQAGKGTAGTPIHGASATKRSDPFAASSFDSANGGAIRVGFFNDSISIDLLLTALRSQGFAKLLANPTIMVLDNETANFDIIQEIPYKEQSETSQGGQLTSTKFKEVGVKLQVTPHITRDGMLRMHIMPEFGIVENMRIGEPPTINTRRLDTIALLKSGQTVVLGGLKQYETTKDYRKVPILGDVPLLGQLFRSESESVKASELVVFIRPFIISNVPELTAGQSYILGRTEIKSPEYPGVSRLSNESDRLPDAPVQIDSEDNGSDLID